MNPVNSIVNQWGPAILVCFTLVTGLIYQNSRLNDVNRRIDDLKTNFDKRIDDLKSSLDRRIDDLKTNLDKRIDDLDKRIDDLKDYIRSEFKRVDRLESPIVRQ